MRFELDFSPAFVPGSLLQVLHEYSADAATAPGLIDEEPVDDGDRSSGTFTQG